MERTKLQKLNSACPLWIAAAGILLPLMGTAFHWEGWRQVRENTDPDYRYAFRGYDDAGNLDWAILHPFVKASYIILVLGFSLIIIAIFWDARNTWKQYLDKVGE
jgi:hypothetical protein